MSKYKMLLVLYAVSVIFISVNEAARILAVYPTPAISHQVVFRPLTQTLVERGHEVVVITTDPFPKGAVPVNLTEINVHDTSYKLWEEDRDRLSKGQQDFTSQMSCIIDLFTNVVAKYFENEEILDLINDKSKQFDLLLIEAVARPAMVFSHIYKAPVILVSSFGGMFDNYNVIGAPSHPILYPIVTHRRISNLSFWDKFTELYQHFWLDFMITKQDEKNMAMMKKYLGDSVASMSELLNNVDMLFLNIHPMFEGIRPVPPGVVYIGGIHQNPEKVLPTVRINSGVL